MKTPEKGFVPAAAGMQSPDPDRVMQEARQHHRAGRLHASESLCRKVLVSDPENVEANNLLGMLCIQTGRPESAIKWIRQALEASPDNPEGHYYLGLAYNQLGRLEEAISSFECALRTMPSNASGHLHLAIILKETGRFDDAAEHFRRALSIRPDLAMAHFHLAHMRTHDSSTDEINAMKALYSHPGINDNQRFYLAFGLGSALDKRGLYDEAFEYFQAGHGIKRKSVHFNLAEQVRFIKSIMEVFSEELMARNMSAGPDDNRPVFIFGMPRSGTTLAEQILASHPQVLGAGELSYVEEVVKQVIKITGKPFLASFGSLAAKQIYDLGGHYLNRLGVRPGDIRHVTDTTPMNFIYVGLIAIILPGARLVHCRRNPMDTCLSIFQQPLADSHAYAHDMADLGGFYRLYEELMMHWQSILPGRIHDLCYEELVSDSETEIRKLLDYCGVPFHDECLTFHKTERSVRTPSASQVRQPIYTASVERWKRYESKLSELKAALQ